MPGNGCESVPPCNILQFRCWRSVMLSSDFKNLLKRNGDKCSVLKVLRFVFCFFVCLFVCFSNYLVVSQLFLQIASQKKMIEKHWGIS